MNKFSQRTIENIGNYVYILLDPRDSKIFYVGKGKANRVFAHVAGVIDNPTESDKLNLIREINKNNQVEHFIVRHGLKNEDVALEIEATLIDFLTYKKFKHLSNITNAVAGHKTWERGIKTVNEIEALYAAEPLVKTEHNLLLININKNFNNEDLSIYEATRKSWVLNKGNILKIDYVLAEYKGIVRAIFKPENWFETKDKDKKKRQFFEGHEVKDEKIIDLYLNKKYEKKKGAKAPCNYIWKTDDNNNAIVTKKKPNKETKTKADWENHASKETVKMMEDIFEGLGEEITEGFILKYIQTFSYVGVRPENIDKAKNFIAFKPLRRYPVVKMDFQVAQSPKLDKLVNDSDMGQNPYYSDRRYRLNITQDDMNSNFEVIRTLAEKAKRQLLKK